MKNCSKFYMLEECPGCNHDIQDIVGKDEWKCCPYCGYYFNEDLK